MAKINFHTWWLALPHSERCDLLKTCDEARMRLGKDHDEIMAFCFAIWSREPYTDAARDCVWQDGRWITRLEWAEGTRKEKFVAGTRHNPFGFDRNGCPLLHGPMGYLDTCDCGFCEAVRKVKCNDRKMLNYHIQADNAPLRGVPEAPYDCQSSGYDVVNVSLEEVAGITPRPRSAQAVPQKLFAPDFNYGDPSIDYLTITRRFRNFGDAD